MLRVDLRRAQPGMKLALPVQNPKIPGSILLKVGYTLDKAVIQRLEEMGVRSIWVDYPALSFVDGFVNSQSLQAQQQVVRQITDTFETMQKESAAKLSYDSYTAAIGELIDQLVSQPQTALFLGDLAEADDDLMRHSTTVTYLSVLMGLKLENYMINERKHVDPHRAKEVTNLGLGAMLHDIGVPMLDAEVRERFDQSHDDSDPAWREHPALGFDAVRGRIDASAATVVLNHHQRYDGSGYAGSRFPVLEGKRIHIFARIAAVADQFDRLHRPAALPEQPTVWVLNNLVTEPLASQFDPEVLSALLEVVPPYPPGSILRLSDGRYAVCVDHAREAPCRPTVQIIPEPDQLDPDDLPAGEIINLAEASNQLEIVECDGSDVAGLNFNREDTALTTTATQWV
jgi:HD-GYP domain-containing protein (c-di-GMP phosphodiesterase class II)